jgi:catalase
MALSNQGKGIVLEGTFTPRKRASSISKAPHLQHIAVPVTVRFSDFSGIPNIADNHELANPRGLAIKFLLSDGSATDMVTHLFNGFPSATADDFHDLLIALGTSGPGVAKPTSLDTYLGSHPVAKTFLTTQKPAPVSFAALPYYGVNTFKFIAADGKTTYGRYQLLPISGEHYLSADEAAKAAPNYLGDEILRRVKQAPVLFKLVLQIAEKGDKRRPFDCLAEQSTHRRAGYDFDRESCRGQRRGAETVAIPALRGACWHRAGRSNDCCPHSGLLCLIRTQAPIIVVFWAPPHYLTVGQP